MVFNYYVSSRIAFSQGVEEGSLGIAITYLLLYYTANLHPSNAARRCKMLVFDRLSFPSILAFLQFSPQIQPLPFDTNAYLT